MHDFVIISVMCFPMLLFSIYPAIRLSEYIDEKYSIGESKKRAVLVITTILTAYAISTLLYYL